MYMQIKKKNLRMFNSVSWGKQGIAAQNTLGTNIKTVPLPWRME